MSGTYEPEFYDVVTPSQIRGDVAWYVEQARKAGGPVLELGAGTGRITLAIANEGIAVHALDSHQGMLDALVRKRAALPVETQALITTSHDDMSHFVLEQRFGLVIAPYRAFLHNVTADRQRACVSCVRQHLRPGGVFAFNVFHPSLEVMSRQAGPLEGVWRWDDSHDLPDGGQLVRSEANRYDTVQHVVHSLHRYERYDADGNLVRSFLHRLEME